MLLDPVVPDVLMKSADAHNRSSKNKAHLNPVKKLLFADPASPSPPAVLIVDCTKYFASGFRICI